MQRTIKTAVAAAMLVVLIAALAWSFALADEADVKSQDYENRLTGTYQKSLNELTVAVGEIHNALSKVQVTTSQRQYTLLLSQVWRTAGEAAAVLGQLPAGFAKSAETSSFLTQTSDYAYFLLKKVTDQTPLTTEDMAQLASLQQSAAQLTTEMQAAQSQGISADVLDDFDYYAQEDDGQPAAAITDSGEQLQEQQNAGGEQQNAGGEQQNSGTEQPSAGTEQGAGNEQQNAGSEQQNAGTEQGAGSEQQNAGPEQQGESKYPHLIYDGPFSESTQRALPLGLGAGDVDEEGARQRAIAFLGDMLEGELTSEGITEGRIRAYSFTGSTAQGENIDIAITVTGGHCLYFRISQAVSGDAVQPGAQIAQTPENADGSKPDEARGRELAALGRDFLSARGLPSMESTYAQYYSGTAVINYAFVQDGTLLYADLIKVWLDVETGRALGYEAGNYLFAHTQRSLPSPLISEDEARMALSTVLEVQSVRMALIPLTTADERFCYEFKCKYGEDSYIVYISALTGAEEQIYRIIDSEEGQLVV